MPPYKLTSAEKAALRRKYLQNIQTINSYLPQGKKIKADLKWFNSRINDLSEQRFYKKCLELNRNLNKKEAIVNQVGEKVRDAKIKGQKYALERNMHTRMIPSDNPAAQKYNEYVMKKYHENPDAFVQEKYQKLAKLNPGDIQKFADNPDLKNFMLDFYEQNEEIIDDGFQMLKNLGNHYKGEMTPEMQANLKAISGNYEMLTAASDTLKLAQDDGYFTLPPISDELYSDLSDTNLETEHKELMDSISRNYKAVSIYTLSNEEFKRTMRGFKENNINLDSPGALLKYVATVERNGVTENISPALHYSGNMMGQGENFEVHELDADTVKKAGKVLKEDYIKETGFKLKEMPEQFKPDRGDIFRKDFLYHYAIDHKVELGKLDNSGLGEIAESIKGDWKERFFGTTSAEYKEFTKAMKDFERPNSRRYKDQQYLYLTANSYLLHKGVSSYEEAARLEPPGNIRAKLCLDVIASVGRTEDPNPFRTTEEKKQAIFDPKDVEEFKDTVIKDAPEKQPINKKLEFVEEDQEELEDILNELK